ncbi:MAG: hypothetical protein ABJC79_07585 [Acidimicrobiia bacterium]
MNDSVDVVVCAGGVAWELRLVRSLQEAALGVRVTRRCADHGELLGSALRDIPQAVLLDGSFTWIDRDLVMTMHNAGIAVFAIGGATERLEAIGAHCLAADVTAIELATALHSLETQSRVAGLERDRVASVQQPDRAALGRMIAVWSGAGSPGRTSVAIHLAIEAVRSGIRTLLVDGDVWSASIAQTLQLEETPSIAQAARGTGAGWPDQIAAAIQTGPHSLDVLAGLARSELWPELREAAWRALLAAATSEYDLVVVDVAAPIEHDEELAYDRVPFRRNLVTTIALERADEVVLVAAADPVGLRRAVVAHANLHDAVPSAIDRLRVILNHAPRPGRRLQECSHAVSEWMGAPPAAFLPPEPMFDRVNWEGRVLHDVAPRSRWLSELRPLLVEAVA